MRTRVIRHNLNPVFDEKMVFQVMKHEQLFTINFTVVDRDKLSGNDFVASAGFPLQTLIEAAPSSDPETGLYPLPGLESPVLPAPKSRLRKALSRPSSSTNLSKQARPPLKSRNSATSLNSQTESGSGAPTSEPRQSTSAGDTEGDDLKTYVIPLILKNKERWEDKHSPELHIRAKYMPYRALRQQFWRVMLKQYDADESGRTSKVELTSMLDTLGSTLKESTIDDFFHRFSDENQPADTMDLTFDQAVICLEDKLQSLQRKAVSQYSNPRSQTRSESPGSEHDYLAPGNANAPELQLTLASPVSDAPTVRPFDSVDQDKNKLTERSPSRSVSPENLSLRPDDLADGLEEHVVEIRECPLCHQPRLGKRSDADIITHLATCASQDWRQVDNLVMGGFVTSSQAQRKWYSKVITKISYGGYAIGANSANILVQDRVTGQINEEKMSVYVRLGIRLLYKGIKSREMEKRRSMFFPLTNDCVNKDSS